MIFVVYEGWWNMLKKVENLFKKNSDFRMSKVPKITDCFELDWMDLTKRKSINCESLCKMYTMYIRKRIDKRQ